MKRLLTRADANGVPFTLVEKGPKGAHYLRDPYGPPACDGCGCALVLGHWWEQKTLGIRYCDECMSEEERRA